MEKYIVVKKGKRFAKDSFSLIPSLEGIWTWPISWWNLLYTGWRKRWCKQKKKRRRKRLSSSYVNFLLWKQNLKLILPVISRHSLLFTPSYSLNVLYFHSPGGSLQLNGHSKTVLSWPILSHFCRLNDGSENPKRQCITSEHCPCKLMPANSIQGTP